MERPSGEIQNVYLKVLASITMEIMQKYVKDDGMVGVDDVVRWPVDSDAFGFLSALSTTQSIESLKEVRKSPGHNMDTQLTLISKHWSTKKIDL